VVSCKCIDPPKEDIIFHSRADVAGLDDFGVEGVEYSQTTSLLALANCRELRANSCAGSTATFPAPGKD
jgi:hypothetical protein